MSESEAASPASPRRRILVVEDNAAARDSLCHLLALAGHDVIEAEDGPSGLEKLASHRPEFALIDIGLPRMDGYAVARLARERDVNVCLVAMTGYGQAEDQRRALDAGFDQHLTKPLDLARLDDLLRRAHGSSDRPVR
jgi:CheY-like chemotaxis protein